MKYRKKPVVVEAYHFTKEKFNRESMPLWLKEACLGEWEEAKIKLWSQYGGDVITGEVRTLEGTMKINEGDYIIKGIKGEFYPCKPDIFEQTYELAE